jgi:hypothetical protein
LLPVFLPKTGSVSWHLLSKNSKASTGTLKLSQTTQPPQNWELFRSKNDFDRKTKLHHDGCSSTDGFDNPKEDNTAVIKDQFQEDITSEQKHCQFHSLDIYSRVKSGKMLVSSQCEQTTTKESNWHLPFHRYKFLLLTERNQGFCWW